MNELMRRSGLEPLFDDMLKGFFIRPMTFDTRGDLAAGIKLDVREDEKAYTVHAELPGVNKEDIHVQIDGKHVSLSAQMKKETEVKEGEKVLRSERYFGQVSRSFELAHDVDEATAEASLRDGVLELVLPKREKTTARKLTIK